MADATRTLELKFDGDASGLAKAGNGASKTLQKFDDSTKKTSDRMARVGDASDRLASDTSQAAGAMGDLGGALASLPGPLGTFGAGMEAAAPAVMGVTGAADLLNLATAKFPALAKVATGASKAMAVGQRALGVAIRFAMGPWGLALIGITALIVVLWKRSETFRRIVTRAFDKVKDAASGAWNWIKNNWSKLLAIITGPIGLAVLVWSRNLDKIKNGARRAKDFVTDKFDALVGFVSGLPGRIGSAASGMFNGIRDAFRGAINYIIDGWNGLEFRLPSADLGPLGTIGGFTLGTPNIGRLAAGGYGAPGRTYLTGEYGPELITFGTGGGMVTPNNRLGGPTEVRVFIGDRELRDLVRVEVVERERDTVRRAGQYGAVAA